MPRSNAGNAMARQWTMLKLLPDRAPGHTARELQALLADRGYVVDKNTVARDLKALSAIFPLICDGEGDRVAHRWYWMKHCGLDIPALDVTDALSLTLLRDFLAPLLPASVLSVLGPRFEQAERALAQLSGSNHIATWADKIRSVPPTLPLLPPTIDAELLARIEDALLRDKQIECRYRSADGRETEQRLHPLALVQRGPVTYLVATAFDYDDAHLYAVHRFIAAGVIDEPARRPKGFSIDTYIADGALQFGNGKMIRLKARVSETLARTLEETPLSEDMRIVRKNGELLLTATVADSWQLRWWVLSWGDGAVILNPRSLRYEVVREVLDASHAYQDEVTQQETSFRG
ncbi:MAG: WYL domain-containing protein [Gammaproteobacteria bacterium]|nr:WYL domain-containing protein [Gammaproteobacteria bacterium]